MKSFLTFFLLLFALNMNMYAERNDTIGHTIPIIDAGGVYPIGGYPPHAPMVPPLVTLYDHTLSIYTDATKQVSVYPVDYDDETDPLYTTVVPENTYSCVLPSWLEGVYAIEIVINGHRFVGEIEL